MDWTTKMTAQHGGNLIECIVKITEAYRDNAQNLMHARFESAMSGMRVSRRALWDSLGNDAFETLISQYFTANAEVVRCAHGKDLWAELARVELQCSDDLEVGFYRFIPEKHRQKFKQPSKDAIYQQTIMDAASDAAFNDMAKPYLYGPEGVFRESADLRGADLLRRTAGLPECREQAELLLRQIMLYGNHVRPGVIDSN